MWADIRRLAGEERKQQYSQNPPITKKTKQLGGARKMAGRKKIGPKV